MPPCVRLARLAIRLSQPVTVSPQRSLRVSSHLVRRFVDRTGPVRPDRPAKRQVDHVTMPAPSRRTDARAGRVHLQRAGDVLSASTNKSLTNSLAMASHLPHGQKITHAHPSSDILPSVLAAENAPLTSLARWLHWRIYQLPGPILPEGFMEADCLTRGETLMVTANPNYRMPSDGFNFVPPVNRLAERVRLYFNKHPELAREKFLFEAVRREIDFREQSEQENGAGPAQREVEGTNGWSIARPALSAEDLRLHAWLTERMALLHYERYGFWPKLRRFIFGNRLVRWLGLQPQRTGD
jgi:hypothetical protein